MFPLAYKQQNSLRKSLFLNQLFVITKNTSKSILANIFCFIQRSPRWIYLNRSNPLVHSRIFLLLCPLPLSLKHFSEAIIFIASIKSAFAPPLACWRKDRRLHLQFQQSFTFISLLTMLLLLLTPKISSSIRILHWTYILNESIHKITLPLSAARSFYFFIFFCTHLPAHAIAASCRSIQQHHHCHIKFECCARCVFARR